MNIPVVIIRLPDGSESVCPLPEGALFAIENERTDTERRCGYRPQYAEVVALIIEDLWHSGEVSQPVIYIPDNNSTN